MRYEARQPQQFAESVSLAELAAVLQLASNYLHKTATIIDNYFSVHG